MSRPLAIFAPQTGAASETFVFRHMERLLPGGTVAIVGHEMPAAFWHLSAPHLALERIDVRAPEALVRRGLASLGLPVREPRPALVARFLREHGVRAVLGEWLDWTAPWLELFRAEGLRCVVHAHGYDVSQRWLAEPRVRAIYRELSRADAIVTVSEVSRRRLLEILPSSLPIHVVPCGVDLEPVPPPAPGSDRVRCVALGRMVAKKAPILLLEAFRRARLRVPGLHLDYVGDGDLFTAAADFVSALSLGDSVTLHGAKPHHDALRILSTADIFLQHSVTDPQSGDEEGLPVSILEAMARSLPVVSTHHAGIPEAMADGVEGFLVAERDVGAMSDRVVELASDAALRRRMGEAGRRAVVERLSWDGERLRLLSILGLDHPSRGV